MTAPKGLAIRANDRIVASVYENITKEFVNYRGLTLIDNNISDFSQEIFSKGFIVLDTFNTNGMKVYIVLYHFIMSETLKAVDIKKLVAKFQKSNKENFEVILVTQNQISTHISNYIKEAPITVHSYTYCNFILVVPKHILVPEYKVLTQDEQDELVNVLNTKKSMFPKIKKTDPCVVWSIAKSGDIIKFTRSDDVAGQSIYYRLVV
jgi:DNA-directed RNA polymerase subunit H (RpoH/RPB5)